MVRRSPSGEIPRDSVTKSVEKPPTGRRVADVSFPGAKSWQ